MDFSVPGTDTESERLPFIQPKMPSELRRLCSMPWDVEGRPEIVAEPGWSASVDIVKDCGTPRGLETGGGSSLWIGGLEEYRSVGAVII